MPSRIRRGPHDSTPAPEDTGYKLFDDQATAMAPPDGEPHYIRMRFDQSVRGLAVDAPVEFLGINIGKVVSLNLDYDEKTQKFPVVVGAVVYPQRLGAAYDKLEALARSNGDDADMSQMMGRLVQQGLRAQARTGNLLTGQLYVALDFVPHAPKVAFDVGARPLTIPTVPGSFDKLQDQLAEIVDKIDKIPFDSIGKNLDQTLAGLHATIKQVNGNTLPELQHTLQGVQKTMGTANEALSGDSPLQQNLGGTLQELQRMARSLRVLTDYLGGHPEALIRGRGADAKPVRRQRHHAREQAMTFTARRLLGLAASLTLAACASAPLHYYTLVAPPDAARSGTGRRAAVRTAAGQRAGAGRPAAAGGARGRAGRGAAEGERWIAPLGDEVRSALSADLARNLRSQDVSGLPTASRSGCGSSWTCVVSTRSRAAMR